MILINLFSFQIDFQLTKFPFFLPQIFPPRRNQLKRKKINMEKGFFHSIIIFSIDFTFSHPSQIIFSSQILRKKKIERKNHEYGNLELLKNNQKIFLFPKSELGEEFGFGSPPRMNFPHYLSFRQIKMSVGVVPALTHSTLFPKTCEENLFTFSFHMRMNGEIFLGIVVCLMTRFIWYDNNLWRVFVFELLKRYNLIFHFSFLRENCCFIKCVYSWVYSRSTLSLLLLFQLIFFCCVLCTVKESLEKCNNDLW